MTERLSTQHTEDKKENGAKRGGEQKVTQSGPGGEECRLPGHLRGALGEGPAGQVPARLFTCSGRSSLPCLDLAHLVANLESSRTCLCQRLLCPPTGPGNPGAPLLPQSERHAPQGGSQSRWPPAPGPLPSLWSAPPCPCGREGQLGLVLMVSLCLSPSGSLPWTVPLVLAAPSHLPQRSHTNPTSLEPPP